MDLGQEAKRKELRKFAKEHGLRPSWHEPDEQEVTARVVGRSLDNAFGEHVGSKSIVEGFQELVVIVEAGQGLEGRILINLATLLAIACAAG